MSFIWNELILNPMLNGLLYLYSVLDQNFVLALTVFTVLIRVIMLPLNMRQQRSMLKTQEMQPTIKAIQEKYRDNPQKMQEEFQRIGYNPAESLSGCLPLLIQMPVLIGLYRGITFLLGATPQSLFELASRTYSGIDLVSLLPIDNRFLWMDLALPDPTFILPILVFGTMFIQNKFMTPATQNKSKDGKKSDDPTAAMTQSMQYTMPIMFGFISLSFPAGLSVYFVLANIIGIFQSYYIREAMAPEKAQSEARRLANEQKMVTEDATAVKKPANNNSKPPKPKAKSTVNRKPQSKRKRRSAKR